MPDVLERLARAIHERYLEDRLAAGARPGSTPALVPWERLPEEFRRSSVDHARGMRSSLAALDLLVVPRPTPDLAFSDAELEQLARAEHARWRDERAGRGWVADEARDDARKRHPDVVDWEELPEPRREIDRVLVRAIPSLLATIGLGLERRRPPGPPS